MSPKDSIKCLKSKLTSIKEKDFYDYFPSIIEDMDYIWNGLVEEMEMFSEDELIRYVSKIHKLVMEYIMEVLKKYFKIIFQVDIKYDFDDMFIIGGCAAYDEKNNRILIAPLGMIIQAINTSSYIQPPIHEFRHKLQHDFYKKESLEEILQYPAHFLNVAKHHAFAKGQDTDFYANNYTTLYPEIDAEEFGLANIRELIPRLYNAYSNRITPTNELQEKVERLQEQLLDDYDELKEDLTKRDRVNNPISEELLQMTTIKSTFSEEKDSLVEVDLYLKRNPQILDKYSVLGFIYDKDRPKYYHEWMREQQAQLKRIQNKPLTIIGEEKDTTIHEQILKIYGNIIRTDPMLQISEYLVNQDIESLKEFIKMHPTVIGRYQKELQELLRLYGGDENTIRLLIKDKQKEKRKDTC